MYEVKSETFGPGRVPVYFVRKVSPMPGLAAPLWCPISSTTYETLVRKGALVVKVGA